MEINRHPPLMLQRELLYHQRRSSLMLKAWLHEGRAIFLRKLGSTAAAEVPRWEYNREHPRRALRKGDFKSHGVAVCTPRQQQRQQQQQLLQVEEKADVGVIGNEGKHVCTFRDSRTATSRAPPTARVAWWGKARA